MPKCSTARPGTNKPESNRSGMRPHRLMQENGICMYIPGIQRDNDDDGNGTESLHTLLLTNKRESVTIVLNTKKSLDGNKLFV